MPDKLFSRLTTILMIAAAVGGVLSLILYLLNCGAGEAINGTGYINKEASLKGSQNFDVDSEGNFYFCTDKAHLIQIYDSESKFKYSIPLPKNILGKGSRWIEVNDNDTVDFYYTKSSGTEIWHYDQKGFLIGSEIADEKVYRNERNREFFIKDGIKYINPNAHTWSYDIIYKEEDGVRSIAFEAPEWQTYFNIFFAVFGCCGFALFGIVALDSYLIKASGNKENREEKQRITT